MSEKIVSGLSRNKLKIYYGKKSKMLDSLLSNGLDNSADAFSVYITVC